MKTSDSIAKISAALAKALPAIQNATKDASNPAYRSTYATLNSVMDAVKPALFDHGIVVVQGPGWRDGVVTVTTRMLHESGEWIETEAGAPVAHRFEKVDGVATDKGPDAQMAGSAISYLRRYSLAAMAGITQEDDDGNAASGRRSAPSGQPAQAPAVKATCPQCDGAVWDNRAKKASGDFSEKSPDYSCKNKDECGWALWVDGAKQDLQRDMEELIEAGVIRADALGRTMAAVASGDLADLRTARAYVDAKKVAG